jgi:hypothetical protein
VAVGVAQAVVAGLLLIGYTEAARRLVGVHPGVVAAVLGRLAVAVAFGGAVVLGLRTLGGVWVADTTWPTLLLLGTSFTLAYAAATWLLLPALSVDLRRLRAHLTPR